jgi:glycosyltransferase involved in cell wall biosynthesis
VLLPVVDEWRDLRRALISVLSQDFDNYEVIVRIDGGAAPEAVPELQDERVKVLSGERLGLAASLNEMVAVARGACLLRLDADDEMLPGRMKAQYRVFQENPQSLIVGRALLETPQGVNFVKYEKNGSYFHFRLLTANAVVHSSVAFSRKIFLELGGYSTSLELAQDYELWCRWLSKFPVFLMEEVVCRHLSHEAPLKMRRQLQLTLPQVKKNLEKYFSVFSLEECLALVFFSAGQGATSLSRLLWQAGVYRELFERFSKDANDVFGCQREFFRHWPYLLGRNLKNASLPIFKKIFFIFQYPFILKAYSLRRLLF